MKKLRLDIERYYGMRGHVGTVSTSMLLRGCLNPRMAPVVLLRLAEFFHTRGFGLLAKLFSTLNVLVFGIEVSPQVQIGGGLFLPHTVGTVIGAERIGENCTIMQGVTLGTSEPDMGFTVDRRPVVGSHVLIGSGAKIIGRIVIGDYARIGANAVVLRDVPDHALAVGVPAKVVDLPTEKIENL
ncbi:serine O-acetyltransferase [Polaromonas sp. YR568]|uniref:serine O-acetyltransferase n=1 Tax=Polaromonas sp. YR568 TaxID=1855301 RepID=UPI0008E4A555|nr:serine O-acetyltransferase [Polaromonas sp. YR568]SFU91459.1 serine O-acetyltransferase [Polaromonas sp. YR568]